MERDQAVKILSENLGEIQARFGVKSLALFGSVARGEGGTESDLDILVTFSRTPGLFGFLDLKSFLEGLFRRPVDLVTEKALKSQLRERILREAVRVH